MSNNNNNNKQSNQQNQNQNGNRKKKQPKKKNNSNSGQSHFTKATAQPIAKTQQIVVGKAIIVGDTNHVRIKHREFIFSVNPTLAGVSLLRRLRVNPASEATFPWLSSLARSFECYKFHQLRFVAIPRCPSTVDGSLIISPDYDAADQAVQTEQEACANTDTVEDVPWKKLTCSMKTERMNIAYKSHYTANDARFNASSQDQKTLDAGFVSVLAVKAAAGAVNWSKLWVEYEVSLMNPQLITEPVAGGASIQKTGSLNINSPTPVNTSLLGIFANEVNDPVLKQMPADTTVYPTSAIAEFLRPWSGYITKQVSGTGLTGDGNILKNGSDIGNYVTAGIVNAAGSVGQRSAFGSFVAGDTLGVGQVTGTTLSDVILRLGASGII